MPKNIVFCADGTWCGPAERPGLSGLDVDDKEEDRKRADITNVLKLYSALAGESNALSTALADEQERTHVSADGRIVQVAMPLRQAARLGKTGAQGIQLGELARLALARGQLKQLDQFGLGQQGKQFVQR